MRLSYVETDDQGQMKKIHGPVGKYANRVRKCCFKKPLSDHGYSNGRSGEDSGVGDKIERGFMKR